MSPFNPFMLVALLVFVLVVQNVEMISGRHLNETTEGEEPREAYSRAKRFAATTATVVAAVIGASATVTSGGATILSPHLKPDYGRGDDGGCSWFGTAPECRGWACPDQNGYSDEGWGQVADRSYSLVSNGRDFGHSCNTGIKTLCCRAKDGNNLWQGTWESVKDNEKFRCITTSSYPPSLEHSYAQSTCGLWMICKGAGSFIYHFAVTGTNCKTLRYVDNYHGFLGCEGTGWRGKIIWNRKVEGIENNFVGMVGMGFAQYLYGDQKCALAGGNKNDKSTWESNAWYKVE